MADAHPKLHAFVAMPFGTKDGVDFDSVYHDLIQPALSGAGFTVARADEEVRAGNIRTDMFQELLLADLVVAELSMDNPNVWYELGVRHALRAASTRRPHSSSLCQNAFASPTRRDRQSGSCRFGSRW